MGAVFTDHFSQQLLANEELNVVASNFKGMLNAAKIGLFTNDIGLSNGTLFTDLVEPVYTGYAQQAAVFGVPYQRAEGGWAVNSNFLEFQMSNNTTPTSVIGVFVTDGAVTPKLLAAERFDNAINLVNSLRALLVSAELAIGGGPNSGKAVVQN